MDIFGIITGSKKRREMLLAECKKWISSLRDASIAVKLSFAADDGTKMPAAEEFQRIREDIDRHDALLEKNLSEKDLNVLQAELLVTREKMGRQLDELLMSSTKLATEGKFDAAEDFVRRAQNAFAAIGIKDIDPIFLNNISRMRKGAGQPSIHGLSPLMMPREIPAETKTGLPQPRSSIFREVERQEAERQVPQISETYNVEICEGQTGKRVYPESRGENEACVDYFNRKIDLLLLKRSNYVWVVCYVLAQKSLSRAYGLYVLFEGGSYSASFFPDFKRKALLALTRSGFTLKTGDAENGIFDNIQYLGALQAHTLAFDAHKIAELARKGTKTNFIAGISDVSEILALCSVAMRECQNVDIFVASEETSRGTINIFRSKSHHGGLVPDEETEKKLTGLSLRETRVFERRQVPSPSSPIDLIRPAQSVTADIGAVSSAKAKFRKAKELFERRGSTEDVVENLTEAIRLGNEVIKDGEGKVSSILLTGWGNMVRSWGSWLAESKKELEAERRSAKASDSEASKDAEKAPEPPAHTPFKDYGFVREGISFHGKAEPGRLSYNNPEGENYGEDEELAELELESAELKKELLAALKQIGETISQVRDASEKERYTRAFNSIVSKIERLL